MITDTVEIPVLVELSVGVEWFIDSTGEGQLQSKGENSIDDPQMLSPDDSPKTVVSEATPTHPSV